MKCHKCPSFIGMVGSGVEKEQLLVDCDGAQKR